MPERRKRRASRRHARHDAVAALDSTRGIDRRRARRRRDDRYARAANTYRTCSRRRRRRCGRRRRRRAPPSRPVACFYRPRDARLGLPSRRSRQPLRPAPRPRDNSRVARAARVERSIRAARRARVPRRADGRASRVPGLGRGLGRPSGRKARVVRGRARCFFFLPVQSMSSRPTDRSLTPSRPTSRKHRRWRSPPGWTP